MDSFPPPFWLPAMTEYTNTVLIAPLAAPLAIFFATIVACVAWMLVLRANHKKEEEGAVVKEAAAQRKLSMR